MEGVQLGCHNMGVARMSTRPEDGVTNRFGQVHDVPNLFVSDGGVFSSSAAANPTLTIVALAIRQADHIAERMSRGEL
jgi:choline dehydrogenase-like flavoprotein